MIIQHENLHDCQSIVMNLDPGCQFFSAKCVQFPLIFRELN